MKPKDVGVENLLKPSLLTSPNCPVADSLPRMVKENISSIEGIVKVDLKLVWNPPWTKDMMSEEAKLELNL